MRSVTAGDGSDSTAAVVSYLQTNKRITLATLYLIGEAEDPFAIWMTDWESPLIWSFWGKFLPSVVKRDTVTSSIGFDVEPLKVTWSPKASPFTSSVQTANPYQLARLGYYDNWNVRVWTVYMPTPGDANTFGCSELFGGRIASSVIQAGSIEFTVNSYLDVVGQQVPNNVIELLNTAAAYAGATAPAGFSQIPQFSLATGNSATEVNGDCISPNPHHIFGNNVFQAGYLVFNSGPGNTLGGVWSAIQQNTKVTIAGVDYNQFLLYAPLPWPPTPGLDTFYVSAASPINQADGDYLGFPYVPNPESAV